MQMTSGERLIPTLRGRLSNPLTSRTAALKQLQTTMPLSANAQKDLKRSRGTRQKG